MKPETQKPKRSLVADPELADLHRMVVIMARQDEAARRRHMFYLLSKFFPGSHALALFGEQERPAQ
jgi:hypothetical protein